MLPIDFQESRHEPPRIVDILAAAQASGASIAGIINADCMTIPQTNLSERLSSCLKDGLVIAERNNLSTETLRLTGQVCYGFDAFFFRTSALDEIAWDEHWKIGAVWWDYWFPLAFKVAGLKVRTLPAPMVLHLNHEQEWSWAVWQAEYPRIVTLTSKIPALAFAKWKGELTPQIVETAALRINSWLRQREPLWTPEYESVDDLWVSILKAASPIAVPPNPYRIVAGQLIDALGLRGLTTWLRRRD